MEAIAKIYSSTDYLTQTVARLISRVNLATFYRYQCSPRLDLGAEAKRHKDPMFLPLWLVHLMAETSG